MKYIKFAIILILAIIWIYYIIKRIRAIKKVKNECIESKICNLNSILDPFGFEYCKEQDIIISKENSWQKDMGYHDLYDIKAPFFNMVMHSEPIYFDYNNKKYRIEFWKGQYGITTGAEVGVYVHDNDAKSSNNYYRCANKDEELCISFELYKKCMLFCRCDSTWWLTGFDIGNFSKPKDLRVNVCISFPCVEMQEAFICGLLEAGYPENKINVCCDTVCFEYCTPKNYKLNHKHKILKVIAQFFNWSNCKLYMYFTRYFNNTLDRLTFIRYMTPYTFQGIIKLLLCRKKLEKKYHKKRYMK